MYATMVKHSRCGRAFWFSVPDFLLHKIIPGKRAMCETARGYTVGTALSFPIEINDCTRPVMTASGATFPLRPIVSVDADVYIKDIVVPGYMQETSPQDEKLAKRFLEYYHTGRFDTNVVISENNTLIDGYSAYIVASMLGLSTFSAIIRHKEERKYD